MNVGTDRDFLVWIHERLASKGDNPLLDFMHRLRAIIASTKPEKKSSGHGKNSMEELLRSLKKRPGNEEVGQSIREERDKSGEYYAVCETCGLVVSAKLVDVGLGDKVGFYHHCGYVHKCSNLFTSELLALRNAVELLEDKTAEVKRAVDVDQLEKDLAEVLRKHKVYIESVCGLSGGYLAVKAEDSREEVLKSTDWSISASDFR